MPTHLTDEGQLQGDIEDYLGVIGCQCLGSAGERESKVSSYHVSIEPALFLVLWAIWWETLPAPLRCQPMAHTGDRCQGKGRRGMGETSVHVAWLFFYEHLSA